MLLFVLLFSGSSFVFNITPSFQKLCIPLNAQVNWVHWFNQGFTIGFESHLSPGNKSKRYSECLYCKWLLKNWHSHLENTSHLSQTNEGLALQSEIDISLWTSTRIFWILREVHASPETAKALLSSLAPPKEEKKDCPSRSSLFINIHSFIVSHGSWNLACWMDDPGTHFVAIKMSAIEFLDYNRTIHNFYELQTHLYILHSDRKTFQFALQVHKSSQPFNRSGIDVSALFCSLT